jgi:hypothetical protein
MEQRLKSPHVDNTGCTKNGDILIFIKISCFFGVLFKAGLLATSVTKAKGGTQILPTNIKIVKIY